MDQVLRSFTHNGEVRKAGEVVNVDPWRNTKLLRRQRYLKPYTGRVVTCPVCERLFINGVVVQYHCSEKHPDFNFEQWVEEKKAVKLAAKE